MDLQEDVQELLRIFITWIYKCRNTAAFLCVQPASFLHGPADEAWVNMSKLGHVRMVKNHTIQKDGNDFGFATLIPSPYY